MCCLSTQVVTYIYEDFENEISSTRKFRESASRFNYDVLNVSKEKRHVGNAAVLRLLYEAYKQLSGPVIYADGADTFFLNTVQVPADKILYSTEKAVWPPSQKMHAAWASFYPDAIPTPWAYLNGGSYCGPAELIAEFFERYIIPNLHSVTDDGQAQGVQAIAMMDAKHEGLPIELDVFCEQFQTIAFSDPGDFSTHGGVLVNNLTGSKPALIHGNGRTEMGWVYDLAK